MKMYQAGGFNENIILTIGLLNNEANMRALPKTVLELKLPDLKWEHHV